MIQLAHQPRSNMPIPPVHQASPTLQPNNCLLNQLRADMLILSIY
jgi:hypothetical protein